MGFLLYLLLRGFTRDKGDDQSSTGTQAVTREDRALLFKILWQLKFLIFAAVLMGGAAVMFVERGGVPHQDKIVITANSDWLVGEDKSCLSVPFDRSLLDSPFLLRFLLLDDDSSRTRVAKMTPYQKQQIYIMLMNLIHAQPQDRSEAGTKSFMECSAGSEHTFKATLYGSTAQPGHRNSVVSWNCRRTEDSFTCHELAAGETTVTDEDIFKAINELPR